MYDDGYNDNMLWMNVDEVEMLGLGQGSVEVSCKMQGGERARLEDPIVISLCLCPRELFAPIQSDSPIKTARTSGTYRVLEKSFSRGTPYFLDQAQVIRGSI